MSEMLDSLGVVLASLFGGITSAFAGIFIWISALVQADSVYISIACFYVTSVMFLLTYKNLKDIVQTTSS
ncbi:MAG: hypothetical protein OK422_04250 [Thaumarchaeota archaeon]|nr:hypothetical protein [Nitrososphaerota archaeon]